MLETDNSGTEEHTKWSKVYLNAKKYMAWPVICFNSSHSHLILTFCDILLIVIMPLPVFSLLRKAPDHGTSTNKSFLCNCWISTCWKSPDSWTIIFVQFLVFHLVCLRKSFCQLFHLLLKLPASRQDDGYKCHARYLLVIYHILCHNLCSNTWQASLLHGRPLFPCLPHCPSSQAATPPADIHFMGSFILDPSCICVSWPDLTL